MDESPDVVLFAADFGNREYLGIYADILRGPRGDQAELSGSSGLSLSGPCSRLLK